MVDVIIAYFDIIDNIEQLTNEFNELYYNLNDNGTCWIIIDRRNHEKNNNINDFKFIINLIDNGWLLRNDIILKLNNSQIMINKLNLNYLNLYLLTKNNKYHFNQILEPLSKNTILRSKYIWCNINNKSSNYNNLNRNIKYPDLNGKNKRAVWEIQKPLDAIEIILKATNKNNNTILLYNIDKDLINISNYNIIIKGDNKNV